MNPATLLGACSRALIVSLVLTPIVRDVFRAYNVVDRPGFRKVHRYPIPRVGGVPIAAAYVIALFFLRGANSPFPAHWLQSILTGAIIIFLTGLIDDFLNMGAITKLLCQILAAIATFWGGIRIDSIGSFPLPIWASLDITVFWLLLTTNALNLVDGLDGLCAGVGALSTLAIFAASLLSGNAVLALTTLPLVAALLGFLLFNFNPATVFLGDSGALLIGFLLGTFSIVWSGHRITVATLALTLAALCIPMLDLASAIVRRTLKNQSILKADRGHMHHRLLDLGLTVKRAALTLYAAESAGALFGLLFVWLLLKGGTGWWASLAALVAMLGAGITIAGFRRLRYPEFEVAGQLLFGREFQSILAGKLRMRKLADALGRVRSSEEWWHLVSEAAKEEHWIRLKHIEGSRCVREETIADRVPAWSLTIELGGDESLLVEGDAQIAQGSFDLPGLADILRHSLDSRRQIGERAAFF